MNSVEVNQRLSILRGVISGHLSPEKILPDLWEGIIIDIGAIQEQLFELSELSKQEQLDLRDKFATAAVSGMLVNGTYNTWEDVSIDAYSLADAMLKARSSKNEH